MPLFVPIIKFPSLSLENILKSKELKFETSWITLFRLAFVIPKIPFSSKNHLVPNLSIVDKKQ